MPENKPYNTIFLTDDELLLVRRAVKREIVEHQHIINECERNLLPPPYNQSAQAIERLKQSKSSANNIIRVLGRVMRILS